MEEMLWMRESLESVIIMSEGKTSGVIAQSDW